MPLRKSLLSALLARSSLLLAVAAASVFLASGCKQATPPQNEAESTADAGTGAVTQMPETT